MTTERPTNLPLVECCATCMHFRGWLDNAWCGRYSIRVFPYTKCDTFDRGLGLPLWVVVEPVERGER